LILVTSWKKFYFQCQFHVANIRNISDIFKYLKKYSYKKVIMIRLFQCNIYFCGSSNYLL
jgi:hypothetical protein